ncbi:helix-turn-helix domain-containing protein [Nonomuraea sp. NPDC050536]|uniref:helix-turn-helix domain-containing protein n=1 Tax=Nonomuraea sp. NPDC050536 TaxID=3364366 RepID=UPI0037C73F45
MTQRGRPRAELVLTEDKRATLRGWARRQDPSARALALRSQIVLWCANGTPNKDVASALGVGPHTVGRWRGRFVRDRLDGLADRPRPGAPRKLTGARVDDIAARALEAPPDGANRWTTRAMAEATGMSQSSVARAWRRHGRAEQGAPDPSREARGARDHTDNMNRISDSTAERPLNATAGSLLGLLHIGPMTGWDLVHATETMISGHWTLTQSQVYRELSAMAGRGLVEEGEQGRRKRRHYQLTPPAARPSPNGCAGVRARRATATRCCS